MRERGGRALEERALLIVPFLRPTILFQVLFLVSLLSTILLDNSPTNSQEDFFDT